MRIASLLAASVVALGLSVAAGSPSQAAQISPIHQTQLNQTQINPSLVQPVGYYWRHRRWGGGYCVRWRNICANRWGWGGWRFRRCLARHGC